MKRIGIGALALLALIIALGLLRAPQSAHAQNEPGKGWIEGIIVTERGDPATRTIFGNGAFITVRPTEGRGVQTENDNKKGGFYTIRDLKPGVYEVFLDATEIEIKGGVVHYRPQHMFGLVVEPNKRTLLNITVHEGKDLEEIGKPTVPSQKAIIISEELDRLQKQIDELKKKTP